MRFSYITRALILVFFLFYSFLLKDVIVNHISNLYNKNTYKINETDYKINAITTQLSNLSRPVATLCLMRESRQILKHATPEQLVKLYYAFFPEGCDHKTRLEQLAVADQKYGSLFKKQYNFNKIFINFITEFEKYLTKVGADNLEITRIIAELQILRLSLTKCDSSS